MKTKFLLLLLLLSFGIYGQNPTKFEKIKITANTQDNGVARILVQDATTGEVKWILKSILDGKFNQPTGNATQYLDGAGNPTTFPTLSQSDRVVAEIRNETGATVTKGTVVYLNGASGGKALIQKAQANAELTSSGTFGVIQSDINNNSNGYAVIIGTVSGLNTSTYTAGNVLWLSPTVAGTFTTTKPSAPNHAVYVGIVTASSTNQGTIEVKIQNGYELDELHDVSIVSKTNNDALIYDSATGLWKNKQFVSDAIVDGTTTVAPSQNAVFDALSAKEPTIATGTTSQYYRGDKSWQTLDKTAVGLGNVDNTSDANKPISTATQTALNAKQNTSEKNQINGYAGLGSDGKLISAQLPSITITDTFVVGSQSAMLALTAETGDVAVRTDLSKSYILKGTNPALLADWQELLSPVDGVTSVFGRVGSVTAQTGDYTTAQVTETTNKKYQTDAQALYNDATSSIQTQLNGKQTTLTNPITGSTLLSGTTGAGYVPRATASTTLTNSNIYDNGTYVGIGTTSPGAKLDVHSVIRATNTSYATFQNAALELFTYNGSSVSAGTSLFSTNSNFNYGTIISNQTNLYGIRDGGIRIATGIAPIVFSNGNADIDFASERMRITSSGNTLIGTTTDDNYGKLAVNGNIVIPNSNHFISWRADGMPLSLFKINSSNQLEFNPNYGQEVSSYVFGFNGTEKMRLTNGGTLQLDNGELNTPKNFNFQANRTTLGDLGSISWKNIQWDGYTRASINAIADTALSNGALLFSTGVTNSNATERMRITSTGNVGIGTTSPVYKFHVNDTSDGIVGHFSGGVSNYTLISFKSNEANVYSTSLGSFNSGMLFRTGATDRMYINSSGNVGIGTTSPDEKLVVDGNIKQIHNNVKTATLTKFQLAGGGTTTNISFDINTELGIPSNTYVMVEISAIGYGNSGSNGINYNAVGGGYSAHTFNSTYHKFTEFVKTIYNGSLALYNPTNTVYGVSVTNGNATEAINVLLKMTVTWGN